jgi:hypothetical protein
MSAYLMDYSGDGCAERPVRCVPVACQCVPWRRSLNFILWQIGLDQQALLDRNTACTQRTGSGSVAQRPRRRRLTAVASRAALDS